MYSIEVSIKPTRILSYGVFVYCLQFWCIGKMFCQLCGQLGGLLLANKALRNFCSTAAINLLTKMFCKISIETMHGLIF